MNGSTKESTTIPCQKPEHLTAPENTTPHSKKIVPPQDLDNTPDTISVGNEIYEGVTLKPMAFPTSHSYITSQYSLVEYPQESHS